MEDTHPTPMTLEQLANAYQQMQNQFMNGGLDTRKLRKLSKWQHGLGIQEALIRRLETLNKIKIARDKLARRKQIKDVSSLNENFQKILFDIAAINIEEQLDRYARGLKTDIWRELCTKEYSSLIELTHDSERVEIADRRFRKSAPKFGNIVKPMPLKDNQPVPVNIGNRQLKKLTAAERD